MRWFDAARASDEQDDPVLAATGAHGTLDPPRLVLLNAPAGSGKTTLLSHLAEVSRYPVAWLTLDARTTDLASALAHLRAAVAPLLGPPDAPDTDPTATGRRRWAVAEDALAALDTDLTEPSLLIVDDLQVADGEPAAELFRLLVDYQPEQLWLAFGSRSSLGLDLQRRRLAGSVLELDADALRFRTWEVEELFRTCHGRRLPADEVISVSRHTGGWAAGLQLFHLATSGRPASVRAQLLRERQWTARWSREYLARSVLDAAGPAQRRFLLHTSVLDEMTGPRCDALLAGTDGAAQLAELERRGLFTFATGDGRSYRYHDVLRAHLLDELAGELGARGAQEVHRHAGALLEAEGAHLDAVRCYCRAQDWDDVRRVLAGAGDQLVMDRGDWLDLLPAEVRDRDPWVRLALARRALADGALEEAARLYTAAVQALTADGAGRAAADELRVLLAWTRPVPGSVSSWVHLARAAMSDPKEQLREVLTGTAPRPLALVSGGPPGGPEPGPSPLHELARAFAYLASGELRQAEALFGSLAEQGRLPRAAEAGALLGRAVAATFTGDRHTADTSRREVAEAAQALQAPMLLRLAHGLGVLAGEGDRGAFGHLLQECRRAGDRWGDAILRLMAGLTGLATGEAAEADFLALEQDFTELGAQAWASWAAACSVVAAAQSGTPADPDRMAEVERQAGGTGPMPYALSLLAIARCQQIGTRPQALLATAGSARTIERFALEVARECGALDWLSQVAARLPVPAPLPEPEPEPAPEPEAAGALVVRCLGGFTIDLDGVRVDLSGLRPGVQELLRLLALHAGDPVREEQIIEWLWPGRRPEQGRHSLQVAVSALRKVLEPGAARGAWRVLRREVGGYRLVLHDPADCDVRALRQTLARAATADRAGDRAASVRLYQEVVTLGSGPLLPADENAEWALEIREELRRELTEAYQVLADDSAERGEAGEAARLARLGLAHDRFNDELWQQLIAALRAAGNPAAAAVAESAYEDVLAELVMDVDPPAPARPPAASRGRGRPGAPLGPRAPLGPAAPGRARARA
jgi:DNA-binding SARP family transcriptional activator